MRRFAPFLLPLLASMAGAQTVAWTLEATPHAPRVGEIIAIKVVAQIPEGWTIYGPKVTGGPVATDLTWLSGKKPAKFAAPPVLAKGESHHDTNFGKVLEKLKGRAEFTYLFKVPAKVLDLTLNIRYQMCDETTCLPPKTQTIGVKIKPEKGPARAEFASWPRKEANS